MTEGAKIVYEAYEDKAPIYLPSSLGGGSRGLQLFGQYVVSWPNGDLVLVPHVGLHGSISALTLNLALETDRRRLLETAEAMRHA